MNKKGFTLIELLAVIVILGVVMLIGTVSVSGIRNKINKNMFESKIDLALGAAKSWGQDNKEQLNSASYSKTVTIGDLIGSGDLKTEEKVLLTEFPTCELYNRTGSDCWVLLNNFDGKVVNKLEVKVYLQYNRVYACVLKNTNNKGILGEDSSWSVYSEAGFYCS